MKYEQCTVLSSSGGMVKFINLYVNLKCKELLYNISVPYLRHRLLNKSVRRTAILSSSKINFKNLNFLNRFFLIVLQYQKRCLTCFQPGHGYLGS